MMTTHFTYPATTQYDDIRGSTKTKGAITIGEMGTFIVVAETPLDRLTVNLPDGNIDGELVISSLVRIWSVVFSSEQPMVIPTTNLELDFGTSIQLNFSQTENCWVLVRSF